MQGRGLEHWRLAGGWTQCRELGPAAASGAPGPVPLPYISFQLQLLGQPSVSSELRADLTRSAVQGNE